MQPFLLKQEEGKLTAKTRRRLFGELLPKGKKVFLYYQNRATTLDILGEGDLLLTLRQGARRRVFGDLSPAKEPTSVENKAGSFPKKSALCCPVRIPGRAALAGEKTPADPSATDMFTELVSVSQIETKLNGQRVT